MAMTPEERNALLTIEGALDALMKTVSDLNLQLAVLEMILRHVVLELPNPRAFLDRLPQIRLDAEAGMQGLPVTDEQIEEALSGVVDELREAIEPSIPPRPGTSK